jgi:hypothetical protein
MNYSESLHKNGFKFEKNFIAKYPEPLYVQDSNPLGPTPISVLYFSTGKVQ